MRIHRAGVVLPVLVVLLLSACGVQEVEDTREGRPVAHRQEAFKATMRAFEPMGVMLRSGEYQAERFAAQARLFDEGREVPFQYFGVDTDYPPSKSKDSVWTDTAGFEKARAAYAEASVKLLAATTGGQGAEALKPLYEAVYAACRDCHSAYRKR